MKAEEPEQSAVIRALERIRRSGAVKHLLLVHTGILLLDDALQRRQAINHNQYLVESAWKKPVKSVAVDFGDAGDGTAGVEDLRAALADFLPIIALLSTGENHASAEETRFASLRNDILWYAAASGGTDVFPMAGWGTVPVIQAKMLYHLAGQYGISWDKKALADFVAALGAGFSVQYLSKLGIRQLTKLIPVYGQTGSGKSSIINALVDAMVAEVNPLPSTRATTVHRCRIDGMEMAHLVDLPGLDGNEKTTRHLLKEVTGCDLIIWVLKANQPARSLDSDFKQQLDAFYLATARRDP